MSEIAAIEASEFGDFYEAVHGVRPFAWQQRLLDSVVTTGRWPESIDSPTGSGKSSVVDVHIFANAVAATTGLRVPRRLVVTVDRRALVDDHADRARHVVAYLAAAEPGTLAHRTAQTLRAMRSAGDLDDRPVGLATLRGGLTPSRGWLDDPTACQVIAATPDMWGSRLLLRGYASTRQARPREAGLLAFDTVAVLDEAHLNHQLLSTARRVVAATSDSAARLNVVELQVTAMSATQSGGGAAIGVRSDDLKTDVVLRQRLERPKPLTLITSSHWPARSRSTTGRLAEELAEAVVSLLGQVSGTVGCIVNTVDLAVAVDRRLRSATLTPGSVRGHSRDTPTTRLLVGRMRPYDINAVRMRNPALFKHGGDPDVDVVVATQTVEVGVDMDFAGLVTELAPGAAIAQRAGRVNRSGIRTAGPVVVIVPANAGPDDASGPYRAAELAASLDWLRDRATADEGLAPWAIHPAGGGQVPPMALLRRPVLHDLEPWNWNLWSATSERTFAEPDLRLWLDDDLDPDLMAGLLVRRRLPRDDAEAERQVAAAPPLRHEIYPVRVSTLRAIVESLSMPEPRSAGSQYVLTRGGEVLHRSGHERIRPGDIVVLDESVVTFASGVVTEGGTESATDVSEAYEIDPGHSTGFVRIGLGLPATDGTIGAEALIDDLIALVQNVGDDLDSLVVARLRAWLESQPTTSPALNNLSQLLSDGTRPPALELSLAVDTDADPGSFWLVVGGGAVRGADEEMRQMATPLGRGPVTLATHQSAVGRAAESIAKAVGLPSILIDAVTRAGQHHDDGKEDARFQRALRPYAGAHPDLVLAKSGMTSRRVIARARAASGLPPGWRHEQASAANVWDLLAGEPSPYRDLVTRLVGTSHGHGRAAFEGFDEVPGAVVGGHELFRDGEWEDIIERTAQEWGTWGVCFLEALLRAADAATSRRGS